MLPGADSGGLFGTPAEKAYIVFGLLIGLAFGPVQASSRSYLARSVTADEAGRYFGIYALAGRATSFLAPFLVATVTALSGSPRLGMAMILLFLLGGWPCSGRRPIRRTSELLSSPSQGERSMPEMPDAGEHHGDAVLVGGGDHLVVAHRAARLDDRRRAGLDRRQQPVGEGEERVRRDHRAFGQRLGKSCRLGRVERLARRDA